MTSEIIVNSNKKKKIYNEDEDYSNLELKEETEPFKNLNSKLTNIVSHISLKRDIKFLTEIVLSKIGENHPNDDFDEKFKINLIEKNEDQEFAIDQESKPTKSKVEKALEEISLKHNPYCLLKKKIEKRNSSFSENEIINMKNIVSIYELEKLEIHSFSIELKQNEISDKVEKDIVKEEPIHKFEKIMIERQRKKSI